jgi:CheY-like chemotaxis protein
MSLACETILLVEDDTNDVLLMRRTLERFDAAKPLQVVANGELAIAYLDGQHEFSNREMFPVPTLVFLDLKLPGLSGFEVLTWVRQQPRLCKLQVVVLTGSRKGLDVYRAYELGATSYLVKPAQPEDIGRLGQSLRLPWLALATPSGAPAPCSGSRAEQPRALLS